MMTKKTYLLFFAVSGLVLMLFNACSVKYSFTGASIPPEVKTIEIGYFKNNAAVVEGTLSQKLTDAMKDKFINETSLDLVDSNGDLIMEGAITDYKTSPVALQGDDQPAMNRLTISVKVKYTNTFDEKQNFETTFSRYADYSSDRALADVQDELMDEINEVLVEDVFTKAVINW